MVVLYIIPIYVLFDYWRKTIQLRPQPPLDPIRVVVMNKINEFRECGAEVRLIDKQDEVEIIIDCR